MQKTHSNPDFARVLFLPYAALVTNQRLRHGQAGFATDTLQLIIRDLAGVFHEYSGGGGTIGPLTPGVIPKALTASTLGNSYISDDGLRIHIGDGTNETVIEKDGTMHFDGTATIWNDIQFSISTAKVPAANFPAWATFVGNLKKYTFDVNDYVDLEAQEISHGYKEGSNVEWHIHIYTNGVDITDRTYKTQIEYAITNINGVASATTVSKEVTIPAGTADRTHLYIDVADVLGASFKFAADISAQFKRIASSGTEPSADPFVSMVGLHIEQDSVGSYEEQSKQLAEWVLTDARSMVTFGFVNPAAGEYAAGITTHGMWDVVV